MELRKCIVRKVHSSAFAVVQRGVATARVGLCQNGTKMFTKVKKEQERNKRNMIHVFI